MLNIPLNLAWRRDRVRAFTIFLLILNLIVWALALGEAYGII